MPLNAVHIAIRPMVLIINRIRYVRIAQAFNNYSSHEILKQGFETSLTELDPEKPDASP